MGLFDKFKKGSGDATKLSDKGVDLANQGKPQKAIKCFDKAIKIDPMHEDAWLNKGAVLENFLNKHEDALFCFGKNLEINPNNFMGWTNKGLVYTALGKYEEAVECFGKATDINPKYENAWYSKGLVLGRDLKRLHEAIECHDKTIQINPGNAEAWTNKGVDLVSLDQYKDALTCFEKALNIDPYLPEANRGKEKVLRKLESPPKTSTFETPQPEKSSKNHSHPNTTQKTNKSSSTDLIECENCGLKNRPRDNCIKCGQPLNR